jgi:RNA polymerase sigma-70 factor, ECF subfamily
MISTRDAMELYEHAASDVYGYLVRRCPSVAVAEDLTAETFLAATRALSEREDALSVGWLIGTARHKLVDHWRREGRQRLALEELYEAGSDPVDSPDPIDTLHVHDVLARLTPHHRAALTLRYLDGLPVEQVAAQLDRSLHATESLLMRAKAAYRALTAERPTDPSTGSSTGSSTGRGRPR